MKRRLGPRVEQERADLAAREATLAAFDADVVD